MSAIGGGLGRVFNVIHQASGVHIPLKQGTAVSFVCFLDAGTQSITVKQSIDGASEKAVSGNFQEYAGPGVGGTWTAIDSTENDIVTGASAANDTIVFTVRAEQLDVTNGFNCVEATADSGTCVAIIHDLLVQRKPSNLASSLV